MRIGLLLAAVLLLLESAAARVWASQPFEPRITTLANGLRIVTATSADHSGLVECMLCIGCGSDNAPAGQEEIAHLAVESLLASHAAGSSLTHQQQAGSRGIDLQVSVGRDDTVIYLAAVARRRDELLSLAAEIFRAPSVAADALERAQSSVDRVRQREQSDPWLQANRTLSAAAWPKGEPTATAQVAQPQLEQLQLFLQRFYTPANMVVCLWGDVAGQAAIDSLQQSLGQLPPQPTPPLSPPLRRNMAPESCLRCLVIRGAEPPILLVGQPARVENESDHIGMQLLATVLAGSVSSRLHQRLRIDDNLAYTVDAACLPQGDSGLTLRVSCQTRNVEQVRRTILAELKRLAAEPMSEEELRLATAVVSSRLHLNLEQPREMLRHEARSLLYGIPPRSASEGLRLLADFKPESLWRLAKRVLETDRVVSVVASARIEPICLSGADDAIPNSSSETTEAP